MRMALVISLSVRGQNKEVQMGFELSARDRGRLGKVHPDLTTIVIEAARLSDSIFIVAQTLRDTATEAAMVKAGKSQTMNSLHLAHRYSGVPEPCCTAVDLVLLDHGHADWDFPHYARLNATMQQAATNKNLHVEWGGAWTTLKDGDHWQLPRPLYKPLD
jgi:peptidoglycan L-alanyl-D-glutamate endopeptidase CwlK